MQIYSCSQRTAGAKSPLMKRFFALALAVFVVTSASAEPAWTADYGRLLGKYATPGGVRYSQWKSNADDMQALQKVVDAIASENMGSLAGKEQLAFYINAYNAWILHEALGKYPTKSVKDTLFTFFTGKRIKVAGQETSFNTLEKETIRSKFGDPNVHFALNCASRSCPPLSQEPFRGATLDAQFAKLARGYVSSERGVRVGADQKTVALSKIFDWYKDDFSKEGGVLQFINQRRSSPLPADVKISYQDYDWGLNEAK